MNQSEFFASILDLKTSPSFKSLSNFSFCDTFKIVDSDDKKTGLVLFDVNSLRGKPILNLRLFHLKALTSVLSNSSMNRVVL